MCASGMRRLHLSFEGQVQGVGFRWTAQAEARQIGLTGWVRNEYDGTVTMELQGTDEQIARFFGAFNRAYAHYPINYVMAAKDDIDPVPGEADFVVKFSY